MATTAEISFNGDNSDCNQIEKVDIEVVTFPPNLGNFEASIQFGSIGWFEKSFCDINKAAESESRNNSTAVILENGVNCDDLQDVKSDGVEEMDDLEEIANLETEPKCDIVCDDEVRDDNISFQGDEEIDDVESVGIHVFDEETEEEKKLNEEITNAEIDLDEKTRCRDAIRAEILKEKARLKTDNEVVDAANKEIKTAKLLVSSKRLEIDYVRSVINRIKNAISVEDINSKINEVGCEKQYETLWLTDENQLIRAMKQLKSMRDRFASNMGGQDEIHLALIQKDNLDELLKNLKKEMKSLKDSVSKAEVAARPIRKAYEKKKEKGKELQAKYRAANELRQEAYVHLSSLKQLLYNKSTIDPQPLSVFFYEDNSVSAVSEVETEKTISFVEEKQSDDQNMEKVESVKPTEVVENKVEEKMVMKFVELKNEAVEIEKQNDINYQNQAEMQVQKEVEQNEKASLERLSSASSVSSSNNIDLEDVLELNDSNEIEKPPQHFPLYFIPKQLKQKTILRAALGISDQNWLRRHWKKMANAAVFVILAAALPYLSIENHCQN